MIHLHVHSDFSFDSICELDDLFKKCKKEEFDAIALTDHHTVYGWFYAVISALKYKIKPLFGIELNVGCCHLTILARNEEGLENIIRLNNEGHKKKGVPSIGEDCLFNHKNGLFVLTGCGKGRFQTLLKEGDEKRALDYLNRYKKVFGKYFAIELQPSSVSTWGLIDKAREMAFVENIMVVPTNDVHYLNESSFSDYKAIMRHKAGKQFKFYAKGKYLKNEKQMSVYFSKEELDNTERVKEMCNANPFLLIDKLNKRQGEYVPVSKIIIEELKGKKFKAIRPDHNIKIYKNDLTPLSFKDGVPVAQLTGEIIDYFNIKKTH